MPSTHFGFKIGAGGMISTSRLARLGGEWNATTLVGVVFTLLANSVMADAITVDPKWVQQRCMVRSISAEQFRACVLRMVEGLPKLDPNRRELFGERYDPEEYVRCRLKLARNQTDCDHHILRRREWPEYWPPGAVRPKWPEAPKESVYRKGMKPREYWEALCKAEAGEFVHRTVKDVQGFYHARPRIAPTDYELRDPYVLEDAYFISDILGTAALELELVQPYSGQYLFMETHEGKPQAQVRLARLDPSLTEKAYPTAKDGKAYRVPFLIQLQRLGQVTARYGITWRGIARESDRINAIAGSEFSIVDMQSGEVLALRRGFAWSGSDRGGDARIWWRSAARCPDDRGVPLRKLLYQVLQPMPNVNAAIKPLER